MHCVHIPTELPFCVPPLVVGQTEELRCSPERPHKKGPSWFEDKTWVVAGALSRHDYVAASAIIQSGELGEGRLGGEGGDDWMGH